MQKSRNRFNRLSGFKDQRKIFYLFTEGTKTEPNYFKLLKGEYSKVVIKLVHSNSKTAPPQILSKAKKYFKNKSLSKHEKEQFEPLSKWEKESEKHGLAISNPSFKYWLLLHYEEGNGERYTQSSCERKLRSYLPNYKKNNLNRGDFSFELLPQAIKHAKKRHQECSDQYHDNYTTVYILMEKILEEQAKN